MTLPLQAYLSLCISINAVQMKDTFPEIWKRLEEIEYHPYDKRESGPLLFALEKKGYTQ
jgi:hypothetical protein